MLNIFWNELKNKGLKSKSLGHRSLLFYLVWLGITVPTVWAAPWLGISFSKQFTEQQIKLLVKGVHPESGALAAGILAGDQITAFDGKIFIQESDVKQAMRGKKTGDTLRVSLERNGKPQQFKICLTERPDDLTSFTGSAIGSKALALENGFYKNADKRKQKPKAVLLDFYATWCGPCRQTLPFLKQLYNEFSAAGLEIIGISSEAENVLESFYQKYPQPYPQYRDASLRLWNRYGIRSVPTLMLLDESGYILQVFNGVRSKAELKEIVKKTLGIKN